ncbi:MAG: sulfite reductase, ferredoxin dependent [Microcystaceae cyanobacterium]
MVTTSDRPLSKVEGIKQRSNYLREPVATEILQDTTHFSNDGVQILKFHGSYQQDNRDNRVKGQEKDYQFMLRTRNPGGFIPPQLYLAIDDLSNQYGNQTLRVTTRQGLQIHGILKKNLKTAIATIVKNMGSTLGACGDINRNVMAPPAPFKNQPAYGYAWEYADNIADLLAPQSGAYYEIWLDGEKAISAEEAPEVKAARQRDLNGSNTGDTLEPIYGTQFMPRKFKCSVTVPGDNSIDLLTQDISLVVITNDRDELEGFNIYAGGGLGRTHNKEETFPRAADLIGYVDKADVYDLVKAIVATQRDYGDRHERRHARMKYLLADWGVEKFRQQVETYLGKKLGDFKPLPAWQYQDYLGWHDQGDGQLFLGISVENGRIKNQGKFQLKKALRQIIEQYQLPLRLTANHNILLYEIAPQDQAAITQLLENHGVVVNPDQVDALTRYAMACPALPTCGLAIAESERILPKVNARLNKLLKKVGLDKEAIVIRMTGCPNGCARPYMAEIGFVGILPDTYQVWLGGTPHQTQLARPYTDKLPLDQLETFFEPLLVYFREERQPPESFGEFCDRVGFDNLRAFAANYQSNNTRKNQRRVSVPDEMFERLKSASTSENRPMNKIVEEALAAYFSQK